MNDDPSGDASATEPATDWRRVRSMSDEEVHAAISSDPDIVPADEQFWQAAQATGSGRKETVSIPLDADVLSWYRREGGFQTRINAILRAYMNAQLRLR